MANIHSTNAQLEVVRISQERVLVTAPQGKLRYAGGNLGLNLFPQFAEVVDTEGNVHRLTVHALLGRMDDFEMEDRERVSAILSIAYQGGWMMPEELEAFESYARAKFAGMDKGELLRAALAS